MAPPKESRWTMTDGERLETRSGNCLMNVRLLSRQENGLAIGLHPFGCRGGEADTIIGKRHKQAIISVMERKSRLSLIYKVEQKTSDQVTEAISRLLLPIKHYVHTVTSDNGKEFAGHDVIAKKLGAEFYFTHPYSSFERGLNENTNSSFVVLRRTDGLIRQYFPKDRDFTTVTDSSFVRLRRTDEEIIRTIKKLNNRPGKCLGFKTPNQVFFGGVNCCT